MHKSLFYFLVSFFLFTGNHFIISQDTDWKKMIDEWREAYHVPGLSVGIIKNGQVIFSDGAGVLEEGKKQEPDGQTLYAIASNTKAFISASIATLVDEGKLNWDEPVRKYLPYFQLYDPCVSEMATIRDLLCHRVGLGTFSGDAIWYRSIYSAEEVVKHASAIPEAFQFRNGFGYSNVMFIAAGEVIRKVTGKSWDQYVKEKFITPLKMDHTVTSTNDLPGKKDVATPHNPNGNGNDPLAWVEWNSSGAAGGIISCTDDMLKWMGMQLNRGIVGTDTFFTRADQQMMWTPQVNYTVSDRAREIYGNRNFNGYGLGWGTSEYNSRQMISHTGGYDGMYSAVTLLPTEKIGVVVLTNTQRSISVMLSLEIIDKLLGLPQKDWKERGIKQDNDHFADRANRIKQRTDAHVLGTTASMGPDVIAGLYRCPMYGDIRIEANNGQLVMNFVHAAGLKANLSHWHYDTYKLEWWEPQSWFSFGTVQILKDNNNKPIELQFDVPNDDIFFEEIHAVRVK
jgi:CubicO group peptidase (beta-lactamase class C family)